MNNDYRDRQRPTDRRRDPHATNSRPRDGRIPDSYSYDERTYHRDFEGSYGRPTSPDFDRSSVGQRTGAPDSRSGADTPQTRQPESAYRSGSRRPDGRPSARPQNARGSQPTRRDKHTPTPRDPRVHGQRSVTTPRFSDPYYRSDADDRAMAQKSRTRQSQGQPQKSSDHKHFTPMMNTSNAYRDADRYAQKKARRPFNLVPILAVLLLVAIVGGGGYAWINSQPIQVTVNGVEMKVGGAKTPQYIFDEGFIEVTPGNFIDVEGEVLEAGKGTPFTLTVNGEKGDAEQRLKKGDDLVFENGTDIEEDSKVLESQPIPFDTIEQGVGPIHAVTQEGHDGEMTKRTGEVSGKTVSTETKPKEDRIYQHYFPDTKGEKVVALTFDDGPIAGQTDEVLDILKENGVKATFFTVGQLMQGDGGALTKRAYDEGHQICTHTWDHAEGSGQGVNLSYMSKQEQIDEIQKGQDIIKSVTGTEASRIIRAPGGNFPLEVWQNVEGMVDAEIGWDVDTEDWRQPGADVIADRIKSVTPGDIVLMHDGGGDRSQTIEAIRIAIPYLKEQGYKFVTIDELMQYPPKKE